MRYVVGLVNPTNVSSTLSYTVTEALERSVSGGLDSGIISAQLGYGGSSSASATVTVNVPPRTTVHVYSRQTGSGGYGTQYRYSTSYASCYQAESAGSHCDRANFQAFAAQGLQIILQ